MVVVKSSALIFEPDVAFPENESAFPSNLMLEPADAETFKWPALTSNLRLLPADDETSRFFDLIVVSEYTLLPAKDFTTEMSGVVT